MINTRQRSVVLHDLLHAPHFGVFHLNLSEAGVLIAKCQWFRGELAIKLPDKESFDFHDPALSAALQRPAAKLTAQLIAAAGTGHLPCSRIKYTLDGAIDPESTFVDVMGLADWLEDCGVILGDAFEAEYLDRETLLAERTARFVATERLRQQEGEPDDHPPALDRRAEVILLRRRIAELEEALVIAKAPGAPRAPITEKQRGAFLNIIGALLGLLLGKSSGGRAYSVFTSQAAIIDAVHGTFGEAPGLSHRNLTDKFAEAKRTLSDAVRR